MFTDILFEKVSNVGLITLNRPKALNALSHEMIKQLDLHLKKWKNDPAIHAVIIKSNAEKAFCAGGDISALYQEVQEHQRSPLIFFHDEYRLNHLIFHYPKPYIALLHGITMGGGVGISIHAQHRVASETLRFAMPETAIGFFPDIGGSYFLSHLKNEMGTYLGLTGERLNDVDAKVVGLIDYCVQQNSFSQIIDKISQTDLSHDPHQKITTILSEFHTLSGSSLLEPHKPVIEKCFRPNTVEKIIQQLDGTNNDFAQKTLQQLQTKSPTSLKVTLQQLRKGAAYNLDQALKMEYRLVQHFLQEHDFFEGIRAVVIDKDNRPKWEPDTLDEVDDETVMRYFTPLQPDLEFNDD